MHGSRHGDLDADVRSGATVLRDHADELDGLHADTHTPVTGRRRWLEAWTSAFPRAEPWTVLVRARGDGRLLAAALLCRRDVPGGVEVAPLGFGRNDRSRLPARTPYAATALADALTDALAALDTPWTFRVEQLPADDAVAARLSDVLPVAARVPGGDVPRVEFGAERPEDPDAYVGKSLRKVLRKSRNRIGADGHVLDVDFARTPADVAALVDEVARVHRARDHAVARESDLDTPGGLGFWRGTVLGHARADEVEIATLRLDGALAAYVVSFRDGGAYRVFDGRFATEWARYSPGRLLETATLARAASEPHVALLDWMNSVAPEKLVCANAVERTEHLVACSPDRRLDVAATGVVDLRDAGHRPTADPALRVLAGVGRASGRRALPPAPGPGPR